ncbi:MAG: hypothetical protein U0802_23510 [Candidatus Binatia bacterium]
MPGAPARAAALVICLLALATPAAATTFVRMDAPQLGARSDAVVQARVAAVEAVRLENGAAVTRVTLLPERVVSGVVPGGALVLDEPGRPRRRLRRARLRRAAVPARRARARLRAADGRRNLAHDRDGDGAVRADGQRQRRGGDAMVRRRDGPRSGRRLGARRRAARRAPRRRAGGPARQGGAHRRAARPGGARPGATRRRLHLPRQSLALVRAGRRRARPLPDRRAR